MDGDCSALLFDEDDKSECDLDDLVKKNLLSELDSTVKADKEYVKVFLRIRPLTKEELDKHENKGCVEVEDNRSLVVQAPKDSHAHRSTAYGLTKQVQKFTFTHIFGEDTSQKLFFDDTMLTSVKEFINGENCLVFSYGVTNSGKTYTIQGTPKDGGLLPRSLDVIFNSVNNRLYNKTDLKPSMFLDVTRLSYDQEQAEMSLKESLLKLTFANEKDSCFSGALSDSSQTLSEDSLNQLSGNRQSEIDSDTEEISTVVANRKREEATIDVKSQGQIRFSIWVSFVEIYNEQMFDLLVPVSKKKGDRRPVLQLREDKNGNPYVKELRQINVSSADEAYRLLALGKRNLKIACTKLNQSSSRSHCIFTIKMIRVVDKDQPHFARVSMLSLCDLAGSERHQKTENIGDRLKEASNINSSLLTLGRCIKALRSNQSFRPTDKQHQVVPFRESKLTRLFQTYLTGKGRVSMIVNINQCASMFDETLNSIRYSAIAQQVVVCDTVPKPGILELSRKHNSSQLLNKPKASFDRATIGWATPGTYEKLIESGELSVCSTFPSTQEEVEEEEEDYEDDCDRTMDGSEQFTENEDSDLQQSSIENMKTYWAKERAMLLDVIKQLKEKLQAQVNAKEALEMKIRAEVCDEMKKQLVIIENQYQESLRVREEISEEKLEKKMEIFMEAMQKSKKRRLESNDEEYVPKHLLQTEMSKVQKYRSRVEELEDELKSVSDDLTGLRSSFSLVSRERESLAQETTKAQFFASDAKLKLEDLQTRLDESSFVATDLNDHIQNLTEECESQRLNNVKLVETIKNLELNNKMLLDTMEERDKQLEGIKGELRRTEECLSVTTASVEESKRHKEELCKITQEMEHIKLQLLEAVQEKNDIIEQHRMEINSFIQEQKEDLSNDLMTQVAELKKYLSSSKNETLVVLQKLNSARDERNRLTKEKEQVFEKVSELEMQIAKLKEDLSKFQEVSTSTNSEAFNSLNKEEAHELTIDLKSRLSQTVIRLESVEVQKVELEREKVLMMETISCQETKLVDISSELSVCQNMLVAVKEQMATATRERDELAQREEKLHGLVSDQKREIAELNTKLSECRDQLIELEKKCCIVNMELEQANEQKNLTPVRTADVVEKETNQSESSMVCELVTQNEHLELTLEKLRMDFERYKQDKENLEEELNKAQNLAGDNKHTLDQLQSSLDGKSELIAELRNELNAKNLECEHEKANAAKLADDVSRSQSEVNVLVEQLSRQKKSDSSHTEALEKKVQLVEQILSSTDKKAKESEEKNNLLTIQLQMKDADLAELRAQFQAINETETTKLSCSSAVNNFGYTRVQPVPLSSNEADDEADVSCKEFEGILNRNLKGTGQSASKSRTRSTVGKSKALKTLENIDPLEGDFQNTHQKHRQKTPAAANKHIIENSTCDSKMEKSSVFKSPTTSPTLPKRRRKLLSIVDEQLMSTPGGEEEQEVIAPSPHTSVLRRLRSRKH